MTAPPTTLLSSDSWTHWHRKDRIIDRNTDRRHGHYLTSPAHELIRIGKMYATVGTDDSCCPVLIGLRPVSEAHKVPQPLRVEILEADPQPASPLVPDPPRAVHVAAVGQCRVVLARNSDGAAIGNCQGTAAIWKVIICFDIMQWMRDV